MSGAQIGTTDGNALIIVFAIGLYRMRALGLSGTVAVAAASVAIAASPFSTQ